ncbi:MAG: cupredoxin domain-containing protein, partial [Nanoarchaeota archaeon]
EAGAAEPAAENVILVPVRAKKWLFQPKSITVKRGDTVQLMITPESGFQFTFALPDFGVGQEIIGPTALEFTADKTGKFPFLCSSCEEFRGMKGMLVVE